MRLRKILIIALITIVVVSLFVNMAKFNTVATSQSKPRIKLLYDPKSEIEKLYTFLKVKSFGGRVYLLEIIPRKVYKGLIVIDANLSAAPYFAWEVESWIANLLMDFNKVYDPFKALEVLKRPICSHALLSLLKARGFKAFCLGDAYPYVVVYAPPGSEKKLENVLRIFALMRMRIAKAFESPPELSNGSRVDMPYVFIYRVPMKYDVAMKKLKALVMLRTSADIAPKIVNKSGVIILEGGIVVYNKTYLPLYKKDPIGLLFTWSVSYPAPGGVIINCPPSSPYYGREKEILDVIAEGVKLAGVDPRGIVVVLDRGQVVTLPLKRGPSPPPFTILISDERLVKIAIGFTVAALCMIPVIFAILLLKRFKR